MRQSNFLKEHNAQHFWHPMAHPLEMKTDPPKIFVKASGTHVEDVDGKRTLDAVGGLWNVNLGYSCEPVKEAIRNQLDILPYCSTFRGTSDAPAIELSYELREWFAPDGVSRVFFTQGGSDSIDTAMRLVRQYWNVRGMKNRTKFIALRKGYHGTHYGGASLCGDPKFRQVYEPMVPGVSHIPSPHAYRNPFDESDAEAVARQCARLLEEEIVFQGPETVAAFVMEPVQGSGGVIVPHASFMPLVREICDRHGVLLVADEVICAFGRTGGWTGSRLWSVRPDVMTIAKALTNGFFPLGATLISEEMADAFETNKDKLGSIGHGYTNSGNPVGCAAGLAALAETQRLNVADNARERGAELLAGLERLKDKYDLVGDVRGLGLMACVELVSDRKTKAPADKGTVARVYEAAYDAGVLFRASGNNLIISPALIVTRDDVQQMIEAMDTGLAQAG